MPKLIICIGLPAAGKTAWARDQLHQHPDWVRVNRDDIRAMLYGTANDPRGRWSRENGKITTKLRDTAITEALARGRNVISDDTNLSPGVRDHLRAVAHGVAGVTVEEKHFDTPLHVCIERDERRQYPVGASVIRKMWAEWFGPKVQDRGLKPAVICDLDGTLFKLNGRDPYDASTCDRDELNENVFQLLLAMKSSGHDLIFVSGREARYKEPTVKALEGAGLRPTEYCLYMRPTADFRKDSVVKEEIYRKFIEPHNDVKLVVDDRRQVVDLWRGLGLECWQVATGEF